MPSSAPTTKFTLISQDIQVTHSTYTTVEEVHQSDFMIIIERAFMDTNGLCKGACTPEYELLDSVQLNSRVERHNAGANIFNVMFEMQITSELVQTNQHLAAISNGSATLSDNMATFEVSLETAVSSLSAFRPADWTEQVTILALEPANIGQSDVPNSGDTTVVSIIEAAFIHIGSTSRPDCQSASTESIFFPAYRCNMPGGPLEGLSYLVDLDTKRILYGKSPTPLWSSQAGCHCVAVSTDPPTTAVPEVNGARLTGFCDSASNCGSELCGFSEWKCPIWPFAGASPGNLDLPGSGSYGSSIHGHGGPYGSSIHGHGGSYGSSTYGSNNMALSPSSSPTAYICNDGCAVSSSYVDDG
jgi:hypothetical protein